MIVQLLTEHHLEFLSLKAGCRGSSESTLVKMSNCWKSHAAANFSLEKFKHMVYFDPIIHHSAGNDQFTFMTLLHGLLRLLRQNRFLEK